MTYMLTLYKITLYLQYVNITYYVILTYPFLLCRQALSTYTVSMLVVLVTVHFNKLQPTEILGAST